MKKFKPQFLYRDDKKINEVVREITKGNDLLNEFVEFTQLTLNLIFTDEEKEHLQGRGMEFIVERVRERFLFKEATDEFNFQAIGINIEALATFYQKYSRYWEKYRYTLVNGNFVMGDMENSSAVSQYIYFTKTEDQNKALALAKKLENVFEEVADAGFLNPERMLVNIEDVTKIVEVMSWDSPNYKKGAKPKIQPNLHFINKIA